MGAVLLGLCRPICHVSLVLLTLVLRWVYLSLRRLMLGPVYISLGQHTLVSMLR